MPIQIPIALSLAATGIYRAKKKKDAEKINKFAEKINNEADSRYEDAKNELDLARKQGEELFNRLGKHKLQGLEYVKRCKDLLDEIDPDIANRIKDQTNKFEMNKVFSLNNFKKLDDSVDSFFDDIAKLGQDSLTYLASTGGSFLTGSMISNYTVRWFSQGATIFRTGAVSLGPISILGGVVLAPLLAIDGISQVNKANQRQRDAEEHSERTRIAINEINLAKVKVDSIVKYGNQVDYLLLSLLEIWIENFKLLDLFVDLVEKQQKHTDFSDEESRILFHNHLFATTIYNIINQAIIDETGRVTLDARKLCKNDSSKIAESIMDEEFY